MYLEVSFKLNTSKEVDTSPSLEAFLWISLCSLLKKSGLQHMNPSLDLKGRMLNKGTHQYIWIWLGWRCMHNEPCSILQIVLLGLLAINLSLDLGYLDSNNYYPRYIILTFVHFSAAVTSSYFFLWYNRSVLHYIYTLPMPKCTHHFNWLFKIV